LQRERLRITSFLVRNLLDYVVRTRISIIRRLILVIILRSTCTSMILAYSRDLNPTEPMNSWMRKQKGVGELSDCMGTSVGTGMFM